MSEIQFDPYCYTIIYMEFTVQRISKIIGLYGNINFFLSKYRRYFTHPFFSVFYFRFHTLIQSDPVFEGFSYEAYKGNI